MFRKEEQIVNLLKKLEENDLQTARYILSERFVKGLSGMINDIGGDGMLYVFGDIRDFSTGDITGVKLKIEPKDKETNWDKIYVYRKKMSKLVETVYSVRYEDGDYNFIKKTVSTLTRKPDGYPKMEILRNNLGRKKDEVNKPKKNKERVEEHRAVNKADAIIKKYKEKGADSYRINGVDKTRFSNFGKIGRNEMIFEVIGYDKGNKIDIEDNMFVIVSNNKKEDYIKFSKSLYKYVEEQGIDIKNNINEKDNFVYIKTV